MSNYYNPNRKRNVYDPSSSELFRLMEKYGINAIPLAHEKIDEWRDSLLRAVECLKGDNLPESGENCDYCRYRSAVKKFEE